MSYKKHNKSSVTIRTHKLIKSLTKGQQAQLSINLENFREMVYGEEGKNRRVVVRYLEGTTGIIIFDSHICSRSTSLLRAISENIF